MNETLSTEAVSFSCAIILRKLAAEPIGGVKRTETRQCLE